MTKNREGKGKCKEELCRCRSCGTGKKSGGKETNGRETPNEDDYGCLYNTLGLQENFWGLHLPIHLRVDASDELRVLDRDT